ncbi:MAG: hypothetical protein FWD49_01505 [Firmicutes bacterium]|nr:hypothetical protein [Bacillota bacterium]
MFNARTFKKVIIAVIAVVLFSCSLFVLASCNGELSLGEFSVKNYARPVDIPDYQLSLKFYDANGNETAFNPFRPVAIVFHGRSYHNEKDSFILPEDIYYWEATEPNPNDEVLTGILHDNANRNYNNNQTNADGKRLLAPLSRYWNQLMSFNIGIFHYESFADFEDESVLLDNVRNPQALTYRDNSGLNKTFNGGYNLTDAFVNEWLKLMRDKPINGTVFPNPNMEVRFIGSGAGANLALSASNRLFTLHKAGFTNVKGLFVPNRVSLLSPEFNNDNVEYNANLVTVLGSAGCVFEVVENKERVLLGEVRRNAYEAILNMSAYLFLRESFSAEYTEKYSALNRVTRDWYLYSIVGSDDFNSGSATGNANGPSSTRPMVDDRARISHSSPHYALSAWTPTPYARAQRGVKFSMTEVKLTSSGSEPTYEETDFTLKRFMSESFQVSDLETVFVGGYLFEAKDETVFINYDYSARLSNIDIIITFTQSDGIERTINTKTDAGGFYSFEIARANYDTTHHIHLNVPKVFTFMGIGSSVSEYDKMSRSTIESANSANETANIGGNGVHTRNQIKIRNCALLRR